MINEREILSPEDSVALLKEGIAVLSVEEHEGRIQVGATGRDDERVRKRVTEQLGDVDVWVVGDGILLHFTGHKTGSSGNGQ